MDPKTSTPQRQGAPQPRQVTTQPQEKAPDAGQPHVPHTQIKQPGRDAPESDRASGDAPAPD